MSNANTTDLTNAIDALYGTGHWLLSEERPADAADVFRAMAAAQPTDERGWLGLGQAHECVGQRIIAKEMYLTGVTLARGARCAIALARVLRTMGNDADAADAIEFAATIAEETDDETLTAIVAYERGAS